MVVTSARLPRICLLLGVIPVAYSLLTTVNYFAYGSNTLPATIYSLRNLRPLNASAAVLPEYRLVFDMPGNPLIEPSAASVRECEESTVHGVVYELNAVDFAKMSVSEGVPFAYKWTRCNVYPYIGDNDRAGQDALQSSKPRSAYTLVAASQSRGSFPALRNDKDDSVVDIPPSRSYLRILRQGAERWKMDKSYQDWLSHHPTASDGLLFGGEGLAGTMLSIAELVNPKHPKR